MKICSDHQDYQVPLIYTYAWNGFEYWCPFCGKHEGMLGAGKDVEDTEELKNRIELYNIATLEFLSARCTLICAETMWRGERIKPIELPEEEIARLKKLCETWELNKKVEGKE